MKILIISDTHGNKNIVENIVKQYNYDYLFFLGDGLADFSNIIKNKNIIYVKGNRDLFSNAPLEKIVEINGLRFLLTHGNTYNVKNDFSKLIKIAKQLNANYVFFGHTHQYFLETIDNVTLLNPGSLAKTRGGQGTFVIMDINNHKVSFQLVEI